MQELDLTPCSSFSEWRDFISISPQGTKYCDPELIHSLGCELKMWMVKRRGHAVAAVPVVTKNMHGEGLPPNTYYVGFMLHPEVWNCKPNRRTENLIDISRFIFESLSKIYNKIEFSLHYTLTDVRGIDWFNYRTPERGRVNIQTRYSAIINLEGDVRAASRSSRRREEGYAINREGLTFLSDGTPTELIELWEKSIERQGLKLSEPLKQSTKNFANQILRSDEGLIYAVRNPTGMAVAAGLVFRDYKAFAHLPVVGTHGSKYGGTLLYSSIINELRDQSYCAFDLNGANSPTRAYFKHSIGGDATLHFHVIWSRP